MSLEDLSSIKGATSSAAIEELFNNIKKAPLNTVDNNVNNNHVVEVSDLRQDVVISSAET